jgi:hypothetical protein
VAIVHAVFRAAPSVIAAKLLSVKEIATFVWRCPVGNRIAAIGGIALFRNSGGSMKKIVLALAVAIATAAAASAQTPAKAPAMKSQTKSTAAPKAPAMKSTTTKAEVVSTDPTAKTITVKDSSGANMTLTATGGAVAALGTVKAGDWVTVTHTDTSATKIVKAKPAAAKAKK